MGILSDEGGMKLGRARLPKNSNNPSDASAILMATENSQKINRIEIKKVVVSGRTLAIKVEQTTGDWAAPDGVRSSSWFLFAKGGIHDRDAEAQRKAGHDPCPRDGKARRFFLALR
jgi:hypothetical protein